jgi:hypothetical protein
MENLVKFVATNEEMKKQIKLREDIEFMDKFQFLIPPHSKILKDEEYNMIFQKISHDIIQNNSSLKEQNKKRSFNDAIKSAPVNKTGNDNFVKNKKFKYSTNNQNFQTHPERKLFSSWSIEKLEEEATKLNKQIEEYEKTSNYDEKKISEIEKFTKLKKKWLKISQDSVDRILDLFPQNKNYEKNTIKTLLDHFKISHELMDYDSENECFRD